MGFADRMKELLLVLDPLVYTRRDGLVQHRLSDLVKAEGWDEAKADPEVRRLMQVFGTEVGREGLGEDVWVEALAKSTKGFYGNERKIVIPDMRCSNEAAFVRSMHGEVWGVDRPDFDNGVGVAHASERDIPILLQAADQLFVNAAPSKAAFQDVVIRRIKNRLAQVPLGPKDGALDTTGKFA